MITNSSDEVRPNGGDNVMTIIIPARNRAGLLKRTLASVGVQTYRPLKVVLVDNDSTDTTPDVMASWRDDVAGDIDVEIITEKRHGATWARNAGAQLATTPYIMFFDSDDEMSPTHVEDFVAAIRSNPGVGIVGRDATLLTLESGQKKLPFKISDPFFNHIFHATLSTQRYAVRRDLYEQAGGWNTKAWGWDDYELGIRLLLLKPQMVRIEDRSVTVHAQADSITGTDFSSSPMKWEDTLDLCEKALSDSGRDDLIVWINVRRAILAAAYRREGSLTAARKLMKKTLEKAKGRFRLRMLYHHNRLMRHATGRLAALLFPLTPHN